MPAAMVRRRIEAPAPLLVAFEPVTWRAGSLKSRGAQVMGLVERRILLGLAEAQVLELLGQPDDRGENWLGYAVYRGTRLTDLGSPHRLRVLFDAEHRVTEAAVVER
jgi:hypothetical protein